MEQFLLFMGIMAFLESKTRCCVVIDSLLEVLKSALLIWALLIVVGLFLVRRKLVKVFQCAKDVIKHRTTSIVLDAAPADLWAMKASSERCATLVVCTTGTKFQISFHIDKPKDCDPFLHLKFLPEIEKYLLRHW